MVVQLREGLKGEEFYRANVPDAQRAVQEQYSKNGRFVANMPLLLEGFPSHRQWFTANSEDIVGIDKYGKFGSKKQPVVITIHGGVEGWNLLTHEVTEKVLTLYKKKGVGKGLNKVYAVVLKDAFDKRDVISELLNDQILPDGSSVPLSRYEAFLTNDGSVMKEHMRYGAVRPLDLARKTDSGYKPIKRLVDEKGKITDSQVIVYAGGLTRAQKLIDRLSKPKAEGGLGWANLGVWHPFNSDNFDSEQAQARLLILGDDDDGLYGNYNLNNDARFVGVEAPKAQSSVAQKNEASLETRLSRLAPLFREGKPFTIRFEGKTYAVNPQDNLKPIDL